MAGASVGATLDETGALRLPAGIARLLARPDAERRLGPFALVEQLGRGGFAPVWLAREVYGETTLRTAAVKLFALPRSRGTTARERARIIEEARALCRVEHPSVVRFYALPLDETEEVMGLAMEHVAGTPLNRRLEASGTMTTQETLAIGAAIASALAAVHRAGLVHRDVKPSNIVEAAGVYKLIDFGIAGVDVGDDGAPESGATPDERTQRVAVQVGTRGYIDPECVSRRAPADASSDLYALGVTLYECLIGRVPALAAGELRPEILDGREQAPALTEFSRNVPEALSDLIDALLSPSRNDRPSSAEWVAIRFEQIRRDLAGSARALPDEAIGPFRGLGRFEEADRDIYFGRSSEVAAALEMARGRGLVALLGPSGSGKSSLARAGLLPAIAEGALGDWPKAWDIVVTTPGRDAKGSIVSALSELVPDAAGLDPQAIVARLAERVHASQRGTLLLVDQLEEMATLSERESALFAAELLREIGVRPIVGVRAVVAARRDLLDPLLALGDLGKVLLRGSVLVEPLTDSVWADVIDRALGAYGYAFEDQALRDEFLAELGQASEAMPLVQFALAELWTRRDTQKKRLTRAGLTSLGGLLGALERHADRALERIEGTLGVPREVSRAVLLGLTTARGTRATRTIGELRRTVISGVEEVIDELEAHRLIVRQGESVTLAHEVLISSWRTLGGWLAEERERRLLLDDLERAAKNWVSDRDHAPLWKRRRLEDGQALLEQRGIALSEDASAFLTTSRDAERRQRFIALGISLVLLAAVVAGVAAYLRGVRAEQMKTAAALRDEQASRQVAERRTQEVQAAQARIDQLLKDLAESPKKEEIQALQGQIRATSPNAVPAAVARASVTTRPSSSVRPESAPPPAAPSKEPSAIKVQNEW
jgi:type II secretory pathway predicted ATPase ExeA